MKIVILLLFSALIIIANPISGQDSLAKAQIGLTGRYSKNAVELRWLPNSNYVLQTGFKSGFIVQRRNGEDTEFQDIAKVTPVSSMVWDSLIESEQDQNSKFALEMAKDFYLAGRQVAPGIIDLEHGIGNLYERKSQEEMFHSIFIISAVRNPKVAYALGLGYRDMQVTKGINYQYRISLGLKSSLFTIQDTIVTVSTNEQNHTNYPKVFVYTGDTRMSFMWPSSQALSGFYVERATKDHSEFIALNSTPFYASGGTGYEGPVNATFVDDSLKNYVWYTYRFFGITPFGDKILFDEVRVMPRDLTPPNNPIISQPKHIKPREVEVKWEEYGSLSDLRGFIVARSNIDTGEFKILHKQLLSKDARSYIDTTFISGALNFYLVYAIDTAGNISASYPAYVALIDSMPPAKPEIILAEIDSFGVVTITIKKGNEQDLKGYQLYTANSTEHEFSAIQEAYKLDSQDSTPIKLVFTDTVTLHSLTPKIFYRVKALDFNYNHSEFSEIVAVTRPDTIPPVTPLITDVVVGETYIKLQMVFSESIDVYYHELFRKTDWDTVWTPIMSFDSNMTFFIDTNVQIGITYYYTLQAIDQSKLGSEFAHSVSGKTYDSGVRPKVENVTGVVEEGNVLLSWSYPTLPGKEVIFQIYKQNTQGHLVQYTSTSAFTFIDADVRKENNYAIKAITTDGGRSVLSELINVHQPGD